MSSRRDHLASQERITKRLLGRHNYDLLKPQQLTPFFVVLGGFLVRDAASGLFVFGVLFFVFSVSLEESEAWLETLEPSKG